MANLVKGIHEYLLNKFIYAVKYDKIANSLYSWILLVVVVVIIVVVGS